MMYMYNVRMDMQVSSTHLRQNLSSILDKVEQGSLVCAVERKGHERVMLLLESDYNSIIETLHLLGSRKNRETLEGSVDQYKNAEVVKFADIDQLDAYITNMTE